MEEMSTYIYIYMHISPPHMCTVSLFHINLHIRIEHMYACMYVLACMSMQYQARELSLRLMVER